MVVREYSIGAFFLEVATSVAGPGPSPSRDLQLSRFIVVMRSVGKLDYGAHRVPGRSVVVLRLDFRISFSRPCARHALQSPNDNAASHIFLEKIVAGTNHITGKKRDSGAERIYISDGRVIRHVSTPCFFQSPVVDKVQKRSGLGLEHFTPWYGSHVDPRSGVREGLFY